MKVSKKTASTLYTALTIWEGKGLLTKSQAQHLHQDIDVQPFDWQRLAKYCFWLSLVCIIIAVSSIFADKALQDLLEFIFKAPPITKLLMLTLISTAIFLVGARRRHKWPDKIYSTEAIFFLGVLTTSGAVYYLGKTLDTGSEHFSLLLLLSFLIYALLGFLLQSKLIWIFSLLSLGSWFGAETGYASGWGAYYLGMNYPLRFVLFGSILTGLSFYMDKLDRLDLLNNLQKSTLIMGLLYLFIALWILSIFGDHGDINSWYKAKQIELFHWSLIFGGVAMGAIYTGIKSENDTLKGFGLTFIFINLYTRYFEYFWNATHKAIFFAILGISLWFIALKAEKIWNLSLK